MPEIDVTLPWVAAGNAADTAASGILKHQDTEFRRGLAREDLELARRRQAMLERHYAEEETQAREELQRRREEREGEALGLQEALKLYGRQFQPKTLPRSGNESFWGRSDASTGGLDDEEGQFRKFQKDQVDNTLGYVSGLSPEGQRGFLKTHLPVLFGDLEDERKGFATKRIKERVGEVAQSPLLSPEWQQVMQDTYQQLDAGLIEPEAALQNLHDMRVAETRRMDRQRAAEYGMQWADQQMAEASGGDAKSVRAMWRATNDWLADGKYDISQLQRKILGARYGLEMDAVKIGRVEAPRTVLESPEQFLAIADSEAENDAYTMLARDPAFAVERREGFDAKSQAAFDKKFAATKQRAMLKYAAQSGVDPRIVLAQFQQQQQAQQKLSEDDVRARLKAAGIDPDLDISPETPEKKFDRAIKGSPAEQRMKAGQGRDPNDDGVYDEGDVEAMQGADGG